MKSRPLWICALLASFACTVLSCGKKKDKDQDGGGGGDTALVGPDAFNGNWNGFYFSLNSDGKIDSAPSPITATFNSEDSTFSIVEKDNPTAYAKGTWVEFNGKSLQLTIDKSTMSRIGSISKYIDAAYDLKGDTVEIHDNNFELQLRRDKGQSSNSSGQGPSGPFGHWYCSANGNSTELEINDNFSWRGSISSSSSSVLLMSGTFAAVGGSYQLAVTSSTGVRADTKFSFTLNKTGGAHIESIPPQNSGQSAESLGDCHR